MTCLIPCNRHSPSCLCNSISDQAFNTTQGLLETLIRTSVQDHTALRSRGCWKRASRVVFRVLKAVSKAALVGANTVAVSEKFKNSAVSSAACKNTEPNLIIVFSRLLLVWQALSSCFEICQAQHHTGKNLPPPPPPSDSTQWHHLASQVQTVSYQWYKGLTWIAATKVLSPATDLAKSRAVEQVCAGAGADTGFTGGTIAAPTVAAGVAVGSGPANAMTCQNAARYVSISVPL